MTEHEVVFRSDDEEELEVVASMLNSGALHDGYADIVPRDVSNRGRLTDLDSSEIQWCLKVSDYDVSILKDWNGESPLTLVGCISLADRLEEDEFAPDEIAERVRERATLDGPGTVVSEQHATMVMHLETVARRLDIDTEPIIRELAIANRESRRPHIPKEAIYEMLHEAQEEPGEFSRTYEILEHWYHAAPLA